MKPLQKIIASFISSASLYRLLPLLQSLNLMKRRVDVRFRSHELRERDLRERFLHDLMETHNNGADSAIARMHANIQNTRVALTMPDDLIIIQHFNDLIESNL